MGGRRGFSASGSYSSNKVNGDFASVKEQSGIQAGDGGFDIRVHGNTDLKGAVIASTQAAVDAGANRLQTGTLTVSDITNTSNYKATGISLSGGYAAGGSDGKDGAKTETQTPPTTNNGSNWSWQNQGSGVQGASAGFSSKSGSRTSTTASGISGCTVVITDQAGQQAKTGQSVSDVLAALNRDVHTGDSANGLVKSWDGQKLQQQVSAGAEITATFGQQAHAAISGYADSKKEELSKRQSEATTPEEKAAVAFELDELETQQKMLNILVGVATGMPTESISKEALSSAADWMRKKMIESSKVFPGVIDPSTGIVDATSKDPKVLNNINGPSAGVDGDGVKLGGTRIDLDALCGADNYRCVKNPDGSLDMSAGYVKWDKGNAKMSLPDFLNSDEGKKMGGLTGGIQGIQGTLAGKPYDSGSWQDHLIEYFAGPHDMIGGQLAGLYDAEGNARRDRPSYVQKFHNTWTVAAIPIAAPFAMAKALPPDVWNAIATLISGAR
ncbi:hypothetical protein ACQEPW_021125 [Xanthomonas oryzae pv. oryzicola]|uniref:hypothetical protein n=1 Tax=Xanthomonas oryzae TaxID=347 RepID=UPI003D17321E